MSNYSRKNEHPGKKRRTRARKQRRRIEREAKADGVRLQLRSVGYLEYLSTKWWRFRRKQALQRSGYRCEKCRATKKLEVHHKHYQSLGKEKDEDLQVLCALCHDHAHQMILEMDQHLWDIARARD